MLANRTGRWSIGAALICLALLAASWFLLITPRRADAEDVRARVQAAGSQALQLQQQIAALKVQYSTLPKQKAELKAIKLKLPPNAQIPDFVRDLQSYADQAGVTLNSIAPGAPAVLSATGTGANSTTVAPVGSVVAIPMSIGVSGAYFEVSLFTKYLQTKLNRSFLISSIAVTATGEGPSPVSTSTASQTPAPPGSPTPTPTPSATSTATLSAAATQVTLAISGSVFVLLDGTSSLGQVTKEAKAAARKVTPTPTPTATGTAR